MLMMLLCGGASSCRDKRAEPIRMIQALPNDDGERTFLAAAKQALTRTVNLDHSELYAGM